VSVPATINESSLETLRLAVGAVSDAAGRSDNQDVAIAVPVRHEAAASDGDDFLLLVADGMGGHPSGDLASRIAADTVRAALAVVPEGDVGLVLKQAYRKANDAVFHAGQEEPTHAGMGTTLTTAVLHGKYATIANVGDSRAYLLRGQGLTQVTQDHTVVAEEVAQGRISADTARRDPRRNRLTHAIGTHPRLESRLPNIYELTLLPGDRLFLCSDGLYEAVNEDDLRQLLRDQDPDVAAQGLVALAKERGTRDNATAVVAAAIPTRVPVTTVIATPAGRTGGVPGTAIAIAVGILLVLLLIIAVVVLGVPR
jgi:serine/threonine protein phosphatase PrpC